MRFKCEICGRGNSGVCTNMRCPDCHAKWCGEGGATSPGHARYWPTERLVQALAEHLEETGTAIGAKREGDRVHFVATGDCHSFNVSVRQLADIVDGVIEAKAVSHVQTGHKSCRTGTIAAAPDAHELLLEIHEVFRHHNPVDPSAMFDDRTFGQAVEQYLNKAAGKAETSWAPS
jgi:hypothetical protein